MRICLMSREYPPETGWGGIGAYTYQMAHALSDLGHDVEVVSLSESNSDGSAIKSKNGFAEVSSTVPDCIKVHRAAWTNELSEYKLLLMTLPFSHYVMKTSFAMWQTFLSLHEKKPFDILEVPEHLAAGIMPIASKALPTVVKLHTPHFKFAAERLHDIGSAFDHQLIYLLERITMVMADGICSPSEDLAQYVANDMGLPLSSIAIVRNPVNTVQFSPDGDFATLPNAGPTVLFVGRLEERKGIRFLIEAVPIVLKHFPQAQFVVVGSDTPHGPGGSALAHCKQLLKEADCTANVTFIPQVELSKMPTYYRAADICVVPSLYDNAPYTCIEAMSSGKPVIGTTAGGTREYIKPEHNGLLVEPKNPQALAEAILRLLQNPEERTRFGAAARAYVLANLSNEAVGRRMVSFYQSAAENHGRLKDSRLYFKDQRSLLPDTRELLQAYDQMIYNYFYQYSLRFRLNHWKRIAFKNPEIFKTKIVIRLARPLARRFPKSSIAQLVYKLESKLQLHKAENKNQAH